MGLGVDLEEPVDWPQQQPGPAAGDQLAGDQQRHHGRQIDRQVCRGAQQRALEAVRRDRFPELSNREGGRLHWRAREPLHFLYQAVQLVLGNVQWACAFRLQRPKMSPSYPTTELPYNSLSYQPELPYNSPCFPRVGWRDVPQ